MLQELFMDVVTMSLTAISIILVVLLARMALKGAPKMISYALWSVVLIRLLCPIAFEMQYSVVPEQIISGEVTEALMNWDTDDSEINTSEIIGDGESSTNVKGYSPLFVVSLIWIGGITVFSLYSLAILMKLKRQLASSIPYK